MGEQVSQSRNASLDIARGLIVALMALDHVRIFFSAAQFDPVDLTQTDAGWFMTRWITHLCAPGFFFIAGLSVALIERAQDSKRDTASFLLIRGAWLILLELLVFGMAWSFNPGWFWFGVIWGLGAAMILLAGLIFLPRAALLTAAAAFTLLHNLLWPAGLLGSTADALLYSSGMADLPLMGKHIVLYPILPWAALMALGYAVAPWVMPANRPNVRRLALAGGVFLLLFTVTRVAGVGQPPQGGFIPPIDGRVLLSFLNVEKYPPSLQYSLVTLGVMALFLALAAKVGDSPAVLRPLQIFGRVPFFFYLLHLFLIHGVALVTATILGWPRDYLFWGDSPDFTPPNGYGFGLPGIYLAWLAVLALLYPLCSWFAGFKSTHRNWWVRLF